MYGISKRSFLIMTHIIQSNQRLCLCRNPIDNLISKVSMNCIQVGQIHIQLDIFMAMLQLVSGHFYKGPCIMSIDNIHASQTKGSVTHCRIRLEIGVVI